MIPATANKNAGPAPPERMLKLNFSCTADLRANYMLFTWFDAKEAKEFGVLLANECIQMMANHGASGKKVSAAKMEKIVRGLTRRIEQFKLQHKLNFYKKSQLGNSFKWRLRDAGWDAQYVDEVTHLLMLNL